MRAGIVILAWGSAIAAPLAAQQQTTDVIPRELAVALLDRFGMTRTPTDIVVGRLPKSFPSDILPREDIRILGGVEHGQYATAVAAVSERPDSATARATAQLERAGWRRAEDQELGGFVPSATARPAVFCRANGILTLSTRERQGSGGSLLQLSISYPEGHSQCTRNADRARGRSEYQVDPTALPTLESPPGARMRGTGMGGGPDSREAFTRLETGQRAADVAAHYAAQLRRAGWAVSAPAQGDGIVVYRARSQDPEKRPLTAALIVLEIAETEQREVVFRVAREAPPR